MKELSRNVLISFAFSVIIDTILYNKINLSMVIIILTKAIVGILLYKVIK